MAGARLIWVVAIGAFIGLLGGLFGKGGSAVATPLLHLAGVSPFAAIASPLPATIPGALIAAWAYHRVGAIDGAVLRTTLVAGVPATIAGALATHWIGGGALIVATDLVVAALGARILLNRGEESRAHPDIVLPAREAAAVGGRGAHEGSPVGDAAGPEGLFSRGPSPTLVVAVVVGLASGLLGNSGGFLLAPLFFTVLHLPLKKALGTSLAGAAGLAVPGTLVHAAMGHIDWSVTLAFALASIPLSAVGARLALRTAAGRLEILYGAALLVLGGGLLILR